MDETSLVNSSILVKDGRNHLGRLTLLKWWWVRFHEVLSVHRRTRLVRTLGTFTSPIWFIVACLSLDETYERVMELDDFYDTIIRQSWAACFFLVHWGCLRLGMLEPWLWWNGLDLHLEGLNLDYDLWVFAWNGLGLHLEGMHLMSFWPLKLIMRIHLWWAQMLGLKWFKKQFWASIPSKVQS